MNIEKWAEDTEKKIIEAIPGDKQVEPVLFGCKEGMEGTFILPVGFIMCEDESEKQQAIGMIKKLLQELDVTSYMLVSEVWTASYDKREGMVAPSENPDRKEGVMLLYQQLGRHPVTKLYDIARDEDEVITSLTLRHEEWSTGEGRITFLPVANWQ